MSFLEEVFTFIEEWDERRKNLPFDIDGVVLKVNDYTMQNQLGNTAKSPRWAIAYRFKAKSSYKLLDVISKWEEPTVTPVTNLKPYNWPERC